MPPFDRLPTSRREFLHSTGKVAAGIGLTTALPQVRLLAEAVASPAVKPASSPESLTRLLYDSLSAQAARSHLLWLGLRRWPRAAAHARFGELGHHRPLPVKRLLHRRPTRNRTPHSRRHHPTRVARADLQATQGRLRRFRQAEQFCHLRRARLRQVRVRAHRPSHDAPRRWQHHAARGVRRTDFLRTCRGKL